jgi:hypothetical protein
VNFGGAGLRLDGKKGNAKAQEVVNEDEFDPRMHKLENGVRPHFSARPTFLGRGMT